MKRFSENRAVARLVLTACVIFSLSFSSGRALTNLRADNEAVFYKGTAQSMGLNINAHLTTRAACAYNLGTIAGNYPTIDPALASAAKESSDALSAADTISAKRDANLVCERAVQDLYTAIDNTQLSQPDTTYALSLRRDFDGALDMIRRDQYNEYAADFNSELSNFPASMLATLTGVKPLPLFS